MPSPPPSLSLIPLLLGALLATAPAAAAAGVEFEGRLWAADLGGTLDVGQDGVRERLDLGSDLGIDEDEAVDARLTIRPGGGFFLRAAYVPLGFAGDAVVSRTFVFGGRQFDLRTRVVSELDIEYGRFAIGWQFLSSGDRRFRFGPLVEAKAFRGEATLGAPDLPFPASASEEFETALPSAGLRLDLEPGARLRLFAEGSVLVDTSDGDLLDAEAGLKFFFTNNLALTAGYRRLDADAEEGADLLELDVEGFFAGLAVDF